MKKRIDVGFHVGFITAETLIEDLNKLPPGSLLKFVVVVGVDEAEIAVLRFELPEQE